MANLPIVQVQIGVDYALVPNGLGGVKKITLADFMSELEQACASAQISSSSQSSSSNRGVRHIYPVSMFATSETPSTKTIYMYFPETRHDILHTNSEYYIKENGKNKARGYSDTIVPNVVVAIRLKFSPNKEHKIRWVTDGNVLWMATPLSKSEACSASNIQVGSDFFPLPYNNQYDNGSMCTGGNSLQSVYYTDFSVAESLYYTTLLASPFNNDLGLKGVNTSCSSQEWYTYLQYCEVYPYWYSTGCGKKRPNDCPDMSIREWTGLTTNARSKLIEERQMARAALKNAPTQAPQAPIDNLVVAA